MTAVRWGFLGAGRIAARALAPAVHAAAGAELFAAAARDPARAARLEPVRVHGSYADLLADDDVDAVYISLANDDHLRWSREALEAGKHVLCEKPLALTAAEVDELIKVAERADRLLVEASMWRWHPRTQRLAQVVGAGVIGDVRQVATGFTFPAAELADNYRADARRGGGALYDIGCYGVSAVLVALPSRSLVDVSAQSRLGGTGVDLSTEAILEFEGASTATVSASFIQPESQWLVISGEGGELECTGPVFTAWGDDRVELLISDGRSTTRESFGAADPYRLMVEAVTARVAGDADAWVLPVGETRRGAELLDSIRAAATHSGSR